MGVRVNALEEALTFLFARTTGPYKFGLERTLALLDALGNPQRAVPVIHVAGTNGKGSSLATAEALLLGRGLRVGKYTSPHLVDFRERFLVDRVPIDAEVVVEFVDRWTPLVEQLGATFFEATTALAFDVFAKSQIDVALIETGLGGRLDSTNVVDPISAGVTSIGWDHMEYLGHTLDDIAMEKAGIFKAGKPAVIGELHPGIREVLRGQARRIGARPIVVAEQCAMEAIDVNARGTAVTLTLFGETERLETPLVGRHQAQNLAFTLTLLSAAGLKYAFTLREAAGLLADVRLPGRFQRSGRYVFDVAHNADGARVLADTLRAVDPPKPIRVLFCALRDKEWRDMLMALGTVADGFIVTHAPSAPESRRWDLAQVQAFLSDQRIGFEVVPDFDAALRSLEGAPTAVITGSFHTVGDAMARLQVSALAP